MRLTVVKAGGNIGMGYLVIEKVIEMEEMTREGKIGSMSKYLVVCVQASQLFSIIEASLLLLWIKIEVYMIQFPTLLQLRFFAVVVLSFCNQI